MSRIDRVDRVFLNLKQWRGPIIYVILLEEAKLNNAWEVLHQISHPNLTILFYIVNRQSSPYHLDKNYRKITNNKIYFPFNLLRDLAIEYISTTQYFVIDGDIVLSRIELLFIIRK